MNLEVGMYVRSKDGYIVKIMRHEHYWINKEEWNYITTDIGLNFEIDAILKASHNIIDLIEVGDYVNGQRIISKLDYLLEFEGNRDGELYIRNDEIKSIVTKEQFESMKYSLEG